MKYEKSFSKKHFLMAFSFFFKFPFRKCYLLVTVMDQNSPHTWTPAFSGSIHASQSRGFKIQPWGLAVLHILDVAAQAHLLQKITVPPQQSSRLLRLVVTHSSVRCEETGGTPKRAGLRTEFETTA